MIVDWSLYVITDRKTAGERSIIDVARYAIAGGATVIQLREKEMSISKMIELGHTLHKITRKVGVPLIVNDCVDVALAIDAEGVHVGQQDLSVSLARQMLGPSKIIGVSAGTVDDAQQAESDGADYLGVGDIFGTFTKPDVGEPIGLDTAAKIARSVSIPTVGIGGVTIENTGSVILAGADGVAVISAVFGSEDPEDATRKLCSAIKKAKLESQ